MENFIVSARKYRPAKFDDVVGQEHITKTLKNAIKNNQVAQAFLFCGPRGVGKTTCARILAKTINCENITPEMEACGECNSCVSFQKNASLNIHELDAASNNSVEDMRNLIEQVRYMPQSGKYKIYIIDEVHMLSSSAFNAFLKTLEEPPSYAIFILATTEKHKILPTILSRCQIFDFNRITVGDITGHLQKICGQEQLECQPDALHIIAQKADGGLRDALSMFDRIVSFSDRKIELQQVLDNLNILDYDYYFKITDALLAQDSADVLNMFDEILQKGFEGDIFLNGLSQHLRDLLVCKDSETLKLLDVSEGLKERYQEQSKYAPVSFLLSALNVINHAEIGYKTSKNKRLHVELAILKLTYLKSAIAPADDFLIQGEVKKNSTSERIDKKPAEKSVEPKEPESSEKEAISKKVDKAADNEADTASEVVETEGHIKKGEEELKSTPEPELQTKKIIHKSSTFSSGFSIGNYQQMKSELSQKSAKKNEENEEEEKQQKIDVLDYDYPTFLEAWKKCSEDFESMNKMSLGAIFRHYEPIINAANQIEIVVSNKVEYELLSEARIEISEALKKNLNTVHLQLVIEFDRTSSQLKKQYQPYTSREKYEKLKEKNPLIQTLKDRLDLELEF